MSKQAHTILRGGRKPISFRYICFLLCILCVPMLSAGENDSIQIYKGTQIKLDIGSPILEIARSKAQVQTYEIAANVNLLNRFFPTLELGYAQANNTLVNGTFNGKGAFMRVGLDLSALRKHPESPYKLLVGIRIATDVQNFSLSNIAVYDNYWQTAAPLSYQRVRWDAWGEIFIGMQVQVYKAFYMGAAIRLKALFTPGKDGEYTPYYIPGYGYKDDMNFGINYYIAWNF